MDATPLVNFEPLTRLLLLAAAGAALPLAWLGWRYRRATVPVRLAALTAFTLFLTFDLIVFGSFTRLTDSGLGCPDWPGCYGEASPLAAKAEIAAAQAAQPQGPVTFPKAWIEMIHRYLASVVGALILVMAAISVARRRELPHSVLWPLATLVWVIVQGLFGKYTVTLKLYPAIVTLHLLGGMALLALLVVQHEAYRDRPLTLSPALRRGAWAVAGLLGVQIALGGWVSTNYAVLACSGFPTCNGQWWPEMDAGHGFTVLRELGRGGQGDYLPFPALVAIHMAHRLFAVVLLLAAAALAWRLWLAGGAARRYGLGLALLMLAQTASGLSNVVLGWPIVAALAHSAGAALWVGVVVSLLARSRQPVAQAAARHAPGRPQPA